MIAFRGKLCYTYSNSFRSLEAIWEVLRRHSSPRRPLTVREIYGYLKEWEEEPSPDTIERMFPAERGLMGRLFPGIVAEEGGLILSSMGSSFWMRRTA